MLDSSKTEMMTVYNSSGNGISGTIDASYWKGQGMREIIYGFEQFGVYKEKATTSQSVLVHEGGRSANMDLVVCFDARGNGDGNTVPTITGDHAESITDYTAVVVEVKR